MSTPLYLLALDQTGQTIPGAYLISDLKTLRDGLDGKLDGVQLDGLSRQGVLSIAEINATSRPAGIYTNNGDGIPKPDGTLYIGGYFHVLQLHCPQAPGYDAQIALGYAGDGFGQTLFRLCVNGTWSIWMPIWSAYNDGPGSGLDADTVDGVHGTVVARTDALNTFYRYQTVGSTSGDDVVLTFASASGKQRSLFFTSNGLGRWVAFVDSSAESGGNVGADLVIGAYTDAGGWLGELFRAKRATRVVDFGARPTHSGSKLLARADFIDATLSWTPGTIPTGRTASTTLTVTGAALGDHVLVSCTTDLGTSFTLYGDVSAANEVRVQLANLTGASQSLSTSRTFNVRVMRRGW